MNLNAQQVAEALPWPALIGALKKAFVEKVQSPVRHQHAINVPGQPTATCLLMPAWIEGRYLGVKLVNVFPGNGANNLPGVTSTYQLYCGQTGFALAQLEGNELTARRTAAASALASTLLSRADSRRLLMVGAGHMAHYLVPAHCSVRPIEHITIYNRNLARARGFAAELRDQGFNAHAIDDSTLEEAVRSADIISCATLATEPLVRGDWLPAGVHLDLVGSFTPNMREADDQAVKTCQLFVDTRAGALAESGDLLTPISRGVITTDSIQAELSELCSGVHGGRAALADPASAKTLFKSVGTALEDLAAAILAYEQHAERQAK